MVLVSRIIPAVMLCIAAATSTAAWGPDMHKAIAMIMYDRLTPTAIEQIEHMMPSCGKKDVAEAACWADLPAAQPAGSELEKEHFVQIPYDPAHPTPYSDSHCPADKCVVKAIMNLSKQIHCDVATPQQVDNFKYLIHYLGDLSQPLHLTAYKNGATDLKVKWGAKQFQVTVHQLWDTQIPVQMMNGNLAGFVKQSTVKLGSNAYKGKPPGKDGSGAIPSKIDPWIACFGKAGATLDSCILEWLHEDELFVHNVVKEIDAHNANPQALITPPSTYIDTTKATISELALRTGVRAAAYPNKLFAPCEKKSVPTTPTTPTTPTKPHFP